ncbi:MAG: hypothetical protein AB7U29_18690 [Desulfobulbus sp.]
MADRGGVVGDRIGDGLPRLGNQLPERFAGGREKGTAMLLVCPSGTTRRQ